MIERSFIGHAFPAFSVKAEHRGLSAFARATLQPSTVFSDPDAASASGLRDCPLPPTYLFCLEMEGPDPTAMRRLLNIDIARVLHGEQRFEYHAPAFAGDVLHFQPMIQDIYDKKNGALEFVVRRTRVSKANGERVATLQNTTVVRNG
jgi:acyl dehydratase